MAPIVNDYFRYKSIDEIEETEKQFNDILDSPDDEPMDSESFDAGDLFN
jgi:hypothetical protein